MKEQQLSDAETDALVKYKSMLRSLEHGSAKYCRYSIVTPLTAEDSWSRCIVAESSASVASLSDSTRNERTAESPFSSHWFLVLVIFSFQALVTPTAGLFLG